MFRNSPKVSLGVSTFETNWDRVEIIHFVEINFFFFSVEIFKIETFQSRLFSRDFVASRFLSRLSRHIEIDEICRDCRDCRDLSRRSRDLSRCSRDLSRNFDKKIQKSMHFSIETNCRETPKFSDLDEFLDLDRDFSIVETNFWKPSRLSITSRLILFWHRDRESPSRPRRDKSRPPRLPKRHFLNNFFIIFTKTHLVCALLVGEDGLLGGPRLHVDQINLHTFHLRADLAAKEEPCASFELNGLLK